MACAGVAIVIAFVSVLRNTRSRARGAARVGPRRHRPAAGRAARLPRPDRHHHVRRHRPRHGLGLPARQPPRAAPGPAHRRDRRRRDRPDARRRGRSACCRCRSDLADGVRGIDGGIAAARDADDDLAAEQLDAAARSLTSAESTLTSWFVSPARSLPIVGPNLDAVGTPGGAGRRRGRGVVAGRRRPPTSTRSTSPTDASTPRRSPTWRARSAGVRHALQSMQAEVDGVRSPWLLSPGDVAHRPPRGADRRAPSPTPRSPRASCPSRPRLLGADGPQRYLVLFTTPVEARGRIGFPGNYAELVVDNGQLSMPVFGRVLRARGRRARAAR